MSKFDRVYPQRKPYEKSHKLLATENKKLKPLAIRDSLTGLHNYNYLNDVLPDLEKSSHLILAAVYLDLNLLKTTNDTLGHNTGDDLLKNTSQILIDSFHPGEDIIVRKGGDEFVVIVKFKKNDLETEYKKYLNNINFIDEEPLSLEAYVSNIVSIHLTTNIKLYNEKHPEQNIPISLSWGTSVSQPDPTREIPHNLLSTISKADEKMYIHKASFHPAVDDFSI